MPGAAQSEAYSAADAPVFAGHGEVCVSKFARTGGVRESITVAVTITPAPILAWHSHRERSL
jgi:hypothetical protein